MNNLFEIAIEIPDTSSEGPGKRYAFWVQGCHFNCPGCCNQEFLPFEGGKEIKTQELLHRILESKQKNGIEGVSILGGEPFTQKEPLALLTEQLQKHDLTVMIYTGYKLSELRSKEDPHIDQILSNTDLLVDGRYNHKQPDSTRRWIGSTNQVMHFLTNKYLPTQACFFEGETVELRLKPSGLVVINGWPVKEGLELCQEQLR